jgi:hypothetical protein
MEDLAQCPLEEGGPLLAPNPDATAGAGLIGLVPLSRPRWGAPSLKRHEPIDRL